MPLKSFIILLYLLMLGGDGVRGVNLLVEGRKNSAQLMAGRGVDVSVSGFKDAASNGSYTALVRCALEKCVEVYADQRRVNMSVQSKSKEPATARKPPHAIMITTRPTTLFTPEPNPFSILSQLQLDEINEAQAQMQQQPEQLKAQSFAKKKKKKKKKKRKNKNKKKPIGEDATVLHLQLTTKKPHYYQQVVWATTKPPKKIKYIVRKKNVLKKKKKEYLNHLKHVLYPFIKFIAFFTVLNPFTLKVFLFTLISPVVFGFLGFVLLSFMVKPALHLIFDVKKRVDVIKRKKWREKKRREKWRYGRRPITIHKHYYKNVVAPRPHKPHPLPHILHHPPPYIVHDPPPHLSSHPPPSWPEWLGSDKIDFRPKPQVQSTKPKLSYSHEKRKRIRSPNLRYNPLLPEVADEIEDWPHGSTRFGNFNSRKPSQIVGESLQFKPSRPSLPMRFGSTHFKGPQPTVSAEYEDAAPFL